MISFISAAAMELMMALFFCEQKTDGFPDDATDYLLIASTWYESKLHSVN